MALKKFTFMTGAHQFRLDAHSHEDALQIIIGELAPDHLALSLIIHTLREENLNFELNLTDSD